MLSILDSEINEEEKYIAILKIFGLPMGCNINKLIDFIFTPRFNSGSNSAGKKMFCYLQDFDIIYANFLKYYKIDLIDDDISWLKFTFLLEDLFLTDNSITKRISYRGDIPKLQPKTKHSEGNHEQVRHAQNLRNKYSLNKNNKKSVQKNLKNMFSFLKNEVKK